MSRHVPLLCRDPFLRDFDREFFHDRFGTNRRNWIDSTSSKIFDQHFGSGLWSDDMDSGSSSLYLRSRRPPREKSGMSFVDSVASKFTIHLDVSQFSPDELKVRVTGDVLEVEGKHEEKADEHGTVSRQFTRKYNIPNDVVVERLTSSLGADGVLTIDAPKKEPETPRPSEIEVPIQKSVKTESSKDA